jgi:hypothetical protein
VNILKYGETERGVRSKIYCQSCTHPKKNACIYGTYRDRRKHTHRNRAISRGTMKDKEKHEGSLIDTYPWRHTHRHAERSCRQRDAQTET